MFKPFLALYKKRPNVYYLIILFAAFFFVTPNNLLEGRFYVAYVVFVLSVYFLHRILSPLTSNALYSYSHKKNSAHAEFHNNFNAFQKEITHIVGISLAYYSSNLLLLIPLRLFIPNAGLRLTILTIALIIILVLIARRLHAKEVISTERYLWFYVKSFLLVCIFPLLLLLLVGSLTG